MRKILVMIVCIAVMTTLFGCGNMAGSKSRGTVSQGSGEVSVPAAEDETENKAKGTVSQTVDAPTAQAAPAEEITDIALKQTVATDDYEFTLNRVELSYKVLPDNPPSYYTYYNAPDDQVYIYVNAKVKNKQKQSVDCDEIYSVTADYNGGYTYTGFNIADDTDGDFTYANITAVNPLQTLGVHCLIACPEEVETTSHPLVLTITLKDGTKYRYKMR